MLDTYELQQPTFTPEKEETYTPLLRDSVKIAMVNYFGRLDGEMPSGLYSMVIEEFEQALLESVMRHVHNNQSKAARLLGLNRGTLRSRLTKYCI